MNVVRDLRNTITHLQAQLQKKQKQIKRQQTEYQQIISSLQSQNEKLRTLLQGDSITITHKQDELFVSKEESQLRHDNQTYKYTSSRISIRENYNTEGNSKENNHIIRSKTKKGNQMTLAISEYNQLVNQNNFLKNQLTQLSITYQKQIEQLVFYFQKIKTQNKRISPAHYAGQMKLISNWAQTCLKDFENQREKYIKKLQQCAQTLQLYENKIVEQNQHIQLLKGQLKENQDKMKMVTRVIF